MKDMDQKHFSWHTLSDTVTCGGGAHISFFPSLPLSSSVCLCGKMIECVCVFMCVFIHKVFWSKMQIKAS